MKDERGRRRTGGDHPDQAFLTVALCRQFLRVTRRAANRTRIESPFIPVRTVAHGTSEEPATTASDGQFKAGTIPYVARDCDRKTSMLESGSLASLPSPNLSYGSYR